LPSLLFAMGFAEDIKWWPAKAKDDPVLKLAREFGFKVKYYTAPVAPWGDLPREMLVLSLFLNAIIAFLCAQPDRAGDQRLRGSQLHQPRIDGTREAIRRHHRYPHHDFMACHLRPHRPRPPRLWRSRLRFPHYPPLYRPIPRPDWRRHQGLVL
jgi:hypothetical protein